MNSKNAQSTRQRILDTGIELVRRKGFSATGLQEILHESGVPKGSFYHYFASKDAFGCAMIGHYAETYGQRLDEIFAPETGSGRDRLMRYLQIWIDDPVSGPWYEKCLVVKLAAEVADMSDDMRNLMAEGVAQVIARLAGVIEAGRADGSISAGLPAKVLAPTLYQMWLGAALVARLNRSTAPLEQAMAATKTLLD